MNRDIKLLIAAVVYGICWYGVTLYGGLHGQAAFFGFVAANVVVRRRNS